MFKVKREGEGEGEGERLLRMGEIGNFLCGEDDRVGFRYLR